MARAIFSRGAAYDVRPSGEHAPFGLGVLGGAAGFARDAGQGACSGLLALLGASHLNGAPAEFVAIGSDVSALENIWTTLQASGLAGPVELLGAVVLFLSARRSIARTLGLLVFIVGITAFANGYSLADLLNLTASWLQGAAGVLEPIPVSDAA